MYLHILRDRGVERLYVSRSVRIGEKVVSQNVRSLGRVDNLMKEMNCSREEVLEWAKLKVDEYSNDESTPVALTLYPDKQIEKDQQRTFHGGYLFPQKIYYDLRMKKVFRNIKSRYRFSYDIDAIFSDLVYARILEPGSKRSSYQTAQSFLEPPKYESHDVYRALSVLSNEMELIQKEAYKSSNFILKRNKRVLYYDCTNYYFEIEEESGLRKYGKSKEHKPNPIVQMGLFMDGDGIPLAFNLFDGNKNEQTSMKPLEKTIINEFGLNKFIVCTDAGLGSDSNRFFNDIQGRSFICTQSLKKLKKEDRDTAMDSKNWKRLSDGMPVDMEKILESPEEHIHDLYYKEDVYGTAKVPGQLMLITYSPKYALYQKSIRDAQVSRAEKMVRDKSVKKQRRNPNDPARFVKVTAATDDGEVASQKSFALDQDKIDAEAMYDGFYAVCTDLVDDDVKDILKVSEGRWEIEESFRIMKSDFEARPVFLHRDDRIRAHFLVCFFALLVYRLLEKKLGEGHTTGQIIDTLREYKFLKVNGQGYLPEYKRTDLTDLLHNTFGFHADTQIITPAAMKKIIADTKK